MTKFIALRAAATIRRRFTTRTCGPLEHTGRPTVILAQTVKGYGLGSAEARNATHPEKKLADQALSAFRTRFDIPIPESSGARRLVVPSGR